MTGIRVVVHGAALTKLKNSAGVQRDLRQRAERVLGRARSTAPVLTGRYRDGLHIEQAEVEGVTEVRVGGSTEYDLSVEAHDGVLSRALDAAGGA